MVASADAVPIEAEAPNVNMPPVDVDVEEPPAPLLVPPPPNPPPLPNAGAEEAPNVREGVDAAGAVAPKPPKDGAAVDAAVDSLAGAPNWKNPLPLPAAPDDAGSLDRAGVPNAGVLD